MTPIEIVAQVIGIIATLVFLYSVVFHLSRKTILIFNVIVNVLWATHYGLLTAWTGMGCAILSGIMIVCFSFKGKNKLFSSVFVPIFFGLIFVLLTVFTWSGLISLYSCLGSLLVALSLWQDKEWDLKAILIPAAFFILIYNVMCQTVAGIIMQALSIALNLYFIVTHKRSDGTWRWKKEIPHQ